MPYITTGFGQATLNFEGANLPHGGAVVYGFENAGDFTAVEAAEAVKLGFAEFTTSVCTSDVQLVGVDVKLGPNDTGAIGSVTGVPIVGGVGGTSLSPGTATLWEKQTALGGRRGRGRFYYPGVYDGWVDDAGGYVSGVYAQLIDFANDLFDALTVEQVPPVLLHSPSYTWRLTNGQPRRVYNSLPTAGAPTPVTSIVPDPMIATQRKRLR